MTLSRRNLLRYGIAGLATAAIPGLAACTSKTADTAGATGTGDTALWYWGDGLSDKVVDAAKTQFASRTTLAPTKVGGDFKQKLTTTLASRQFIPDITGVKGEDMANFRANADQFVDLNQHGFADLAPQYLEWKVKQATTADGKVIGFPIDIGPTGMYFRADVFEKAGLPTDPAAVSAAIGTWDAFYDAAVAAKGKVPGTFLVSNINGIFNMAIGQGVNRFIDQNNAFIGDQAHVRQAWDIAVRAQTLGVTAKMEDGTPDWTAAITKGTIPALIGAAWMSIDIRNSAASTAGKWRVASTPGGAGNFGGSFLAIPKQAKDPQLAYDIVSWILSPDNAVKNYTDAGLFPAAPAAYQAAALTTGDDFFGGQKTIDIFGPAAQKVPAFYEAAADAAVSAPYFNQLGNVEQGKNPDQAWADAVKEAKQIGSRQGVK